MFRNISDADCASEFIISGLKFEANQSIELSDEQGLFKTKLISSHGPMISDFVTHEQYFKYKTYGIHVGQDDRLTFMGDTKRKIEGYFVDCRQDSPTLHQIVRLRFASSLKRRLVIPRGVAHTFDNLERIVTRDEPIWFVDEYNLAWNIDNDLVSVSRDTKLEDFPTVRPNRLRLPDEGHIYLSKISQALLENPKSYMARYEVNIAGSNTYVMVEPKHWSDDKKYLKGLTSSIMIPGVTAGINRYALTGASSFTLVPNTDACVADILILGAKNERESKHYWHARTNKIYTFLNNEGGVVDISCVDLRVSSPTYGQRIVSSLPCDPRIRYFIEQGVAYSFKCSQELIVRCEHEVFADLYEPRHDIPMFGEDMISLQMDHEYPALRLPSLKCPGSIVYKMAQFEQQQLSQI